MHPGEPGEKLIPGGLSFPYIAEVRKTNFLPRAFFAQSKAASKRVAPQPRRHPLFQIIAVPFDAFQALPSPQHRWLLTCLARYTDRAGECWPSMRQLAADARMSLSTVSRRLQEMADLAVFQRTRKGVGRYAYQLAEAYRPRWPGRVSGPKHRVSQAGTAGQAEPIKQTEGAPARQRFAKSGFSYGEIPDECVKWQARLRSWRQSRFWLPLWGPKPDQPGCFAPPDLLLKTG